MAKDTRKKKRVVGDIQPRKKAPRGTAEETARILAAQGRTRPAPVAGPSTGRTRERGGRERPARTVKPQFRSGSDAPPVVIPPRGEIFDTAVALGTLIPSPASAGIRIGQGIRGAFPTIGRRGAQTTAQEAARFRRAAKELRAQSKGQPQGSTEAGKISEIEAEKLRRSNKAFQEKIEKGLEEGFEKQFGVNIKEVQKQIAGNNEKIRQKVIKGDLGEEHLSGLPELTKAERAQRATNLLKQPARARGRSLREALEEDEEIGRAFARERRAEGRSPAARLKRPPQARDRAEMIAEIEKARGRTPAEVRTLPNVEAQMRRIRIKREQAQGLPSSDAERVRVATQRIREGSIPPQNRVPGVTGRPQPIPKQPPGAEFGPAVQQVTEGSIGSIRGTVFQRRQQEDHDLRIFGIRRGEPRWREKLREARKRASQRLKQIRKERVRNAKRLEKESKKRRERKE